MNLSDQFQQKTLLSFEVFPPKRTASIQTVYDALDGLAGLKADFISVTYGAGGSANNQATVDIASTIKNTYGIESVAHLPGIGLTKDDVLYLLGELKANNIENVMALRGDLSPDVAPKNDFPHADALVTFIRQNSDLNIIGACYPEKHPEAKSVVDDIHYLKQKVDAGVGHLVTQLFFDNQFFYEFRERAAIAHIDVPVQAGIMPVVNARQIQRITSLCGATLPKKFTKMMARYEDNPQAIRDAGIAYAVNQIVDLLTQGVDGIHLYTMNNPLVATRICEAVASLFAV